MIYQNVSMHSVIARVIRNTRVTDSYYVLLMREWIPEAMGYMRTKVELQPKCEEVPIVFHKGKLPCDLRFITAVVYNNTRLSESMNALSTSAARPAPVDMYDAISTMAPTTNPVTLNTNWVGNFTTQEELEVQGMAQNLYHYYSIFPGVIQTSFADGKVAVHYRAIPCDDAGLPLIPDNEDYKQALYYYVRAMMVGAGFKDPVFKEDILMSRFELHAARAIEQITYPSVDRMEHAANLLNRLIPQENYFQNFFISNSPESFNQQ